MDADLAFRLIPAAWILLGSLQALQGLGIEVLTDQYFGCHQPLGEGLMLGLVNVLVGLGFQVVVLVLGD